MILISLRQFVRRVLKVIGAGELLHLHSDPLRTVPAVWSKCTCVCGVCVCVRVCTCGVCVCVCMCVVCVCVCVCVHVCVCMEGQADL